jgi:type IV secretory pathway TraG/TraD family ATPase VirD4
MQPPWERRRSPIWKALGWLLAALWLHNVIDPGGGDVLIWCIKVVVLGWAAKKLVRAIRDEQLPIAWAARLAEQAAWRLAIAFVRHAPIRMVKGVATLKEVVALKRRRDHHNAPPRAFKSTADEVRWEIERKGGGAYLGRDEEGAWVTAERESAVMVLGPPRSGKTSAVMIPALLGAPGAVVSTSTKPDVMRATRRARRELGEVWLFDPAGTEPTPNGVRALRWSPVAAAGTWDGALMMARAMTASTRPGRGTTNESHWSERAAALLAPLLYAAHKTNRPIEDVVRWTLRQDMSEALKTLSEDERNRVATDVLIGIERTDARERSSIYSASAGVLAAYNADATRATAKDPNFDPRRFVGSTDTIYITAPEHGQALCAPLIVGLLEQLRHAVYESARAKHGARSAPMLWALDEVANIAPIHDLPALVSQAGGQNLQVLVGLQDLSQARTRWGETAADGFMSLFQTRLILNGIADGKTLEGISLALGEYDRRLVSASRGMSEHTEWLGPNDHNHSEGLSYQTQRQRTLSPGEIARLPDGHGLLLRGASWGLIGLTPWYAHRPWANIANNANHAR